MKNTVIPLFTFSFVLHLALSAAVPMRWTVDVSRVQPEVRDVVRGETVALEATLQSGGKPFATGPEPVCIFWQTNGMGSAWWTAPASVTNHPITQSSNQSILSATFTPEMDPGAATVNGFLGSSGSMYRAIFTLRFRHGPGATPNELPLPQKVIDFSKVTVANPPWPSGAAKTLPKYLHEISFDDTYPEDAAWYYAQPQPYGSCSAVRDGGFLFRNYDWRFDDDAEFVVRVSAGRDALRRVRFASVGVANCGTNLTESFVTGGKPSRYYKCLPGRVVDGINENGVVCEVNVVDGDPQTSGWDATGDIHPLAAVRWALDNGKTAEDAATNLAVRIAFPPGWAQNFHWMVADERETWIVENGTASNVTAVAAKRVMTNFPILPDTYSGTGAERYQLLLCGGSITNAWYTRAYRPDTTPPWVSDLAEVIGETNRIFDVWAAHPKEYFRSTTTTSNYNYTWWQTVHTSIYDITNRVLRIAVQEQNDWYTFQVPSAGGVNPEAVKEIVAPMVADATNALRLVDDMAVYEWTVSPDGPWTWHCDNEEVLVALGTKSPVWSVDGEVWRPPFNIEPFGDNDSPITFDYSATRVDVAVYDTRDVSKIYYVYATRPKSLQATSDRLATTNGVRAVETNLTANLDLKRDLDDLAYVTTVPGGWLPQEVDGHRYDIHYDGYSGWHVEKLTYYPEWGEWYYDDYEFVAGPEDAETLTAHKIWSDETITFTRQHVEVRDSLALVSQIGSQAEVAARNYIQNNDIVKTKTLLRTGKPGEYGTGWGTMHYQFSSDRRWWSIIVPTLTASWSTGGYVDTDGTFVSASTVRFPGQSYAYYRADPISQRDHTPVARFVSSSGTNGSARCSAATWSVGITAGPGTSSSSVRFDNSADLGAMPFLVTVDVNHAAGFGSAVCRDSSSFPPMEFDLQDYYRNHYLIGNFRYGEATVTNRTVSVKCLYDVYVSFSTSMRTNYTAWCTLNLGCSAESYITTNQDYGRVLTDTTRGLYYDGGLKATWRVGVTNGCFFAEVISTNNLAEGVN